MFLSGCCSDVAEDLVTDLVVFHKGIGNWHEGIFIPGAGWAFKEDLEDNLLANELKFALTPNDSPNSPKRILPISVKRIDKLTWLT